MKIFGAGSNHLQETKSSIYTSVQQYFFGLKMFQQLCCEFGLQDLENSFTRGDFNTLADRVGLLGCNNLNLNYQYACFEKEKR